jgi:TDG/mug DNA glycosylase family protein
VRCDVETDRGATCPPPRWGRAPSAHRHKPHMAAARQLLQPRRRLTLEGAYFAGVAVARALHLPKPIVGQAMSDALLTDPASRPGHERRAPDARGDPSPCGDAIPRGVPTRSNPVSDVIGRGLNVLFVGINPGFVSARAGHHFANPANSFWRLLHESGFTPRRLRPTEEDELLTGRIGLTNLVARESRGVAGLSREDFSRGRRALLRKVQRLQPRAVVFVGITAYRAFSQTTKPVSCGEQAEPIATARAFVLPNPSGRNAHFTYAELRKLYRSVAMSLGYVRGEVPVRSPAAPRRRRRPELSPAPADRGRGEHE